MSAGLADCCGPHSSLLSGVMLVAARREQRRPSRSESELGELSIEGSDALVLGGLGLGGDLLLLGGVEGGRLDLSLLLEFVDDVGLGPTGERGQLSERAVVPVGLQTERAESIRNHHSLLLVVWEGDTLEDLQLAESGGATGQLVWEHAARALPENA